MEATMNALVSAVITLNNIIEKSSSIVLSEKYSNFSNIFDKVRADKLLCYSEYDLSIKMKKGKQSLFGPIYDYS